MHFSRLILPAAVCLAGCSKPAVGPVSSQHTEPVPQEITCVNNLKQIGLGFRMWALDNSDQYPFNVSTNSGGTMELSGLDRDGFDTNAWIHLQAMSNDLTVPLILICPKAKSTKPASDFQHLRPENVTYRIHSGTNSSDAHPTNILAICPIHGNILYCDGSVKEISKD
jgi:prepilin-type processing-associated H-X9-DG protein